MRRTSPARLSLARGGPAWAPPSALAIGEPDGAAPTAAFRALLHLRFTTGGADEIAIDAAATTLRGRFLPLDRDALIAAAEPAASLAATGGGIRIVLVTPRRLESVRLKPASSPARGSKLRVHRVDGEAVAEKPTATASNRGLESRIRERAVAPSFALAGPAAGGGRALGVGAGLTDHLAIGSDPRLFALSGDEPFDADRFALFLDDPLGNPVAIAPGDLGAVGIRAFPSGPRIGLALLPAEAPAPGAPAADAPLEQPNFFFRADGLVGGGEVPLAAGVFAAGADLAAALEGALARLAAPLPAAIDCTLVFASDSPCRLELDALEVGYRLVRSSWPAAAPAAASTPDRDKRSVRFGPGSVAAAAGAPLLIELPAGARLESARIAGSLRLGAHHPPPAGLPALALASTVGVEIAEGTAALQRIDPAVSEVTAIALPLLPLERDTAVRLEILDDAEGELGPVAASSELALERAGARRWAVFPLARPAMFAARPVWLRLVATRGALLWLARPASGAIRRTESPTPRGLPPELPPISGHQAIHELLTSTAGPENPAGPVTLRLANAQIPNVAANEDEALFDCTTALADLLATSPGAPFQAVLVFASDFAGQLTLTPPRIEYAPE